MRIRYADKTDVGMKRTHNEDYFSLIEDEQLFLVCDGMGGHASGEVASKMAAETLGEFFQRTRQGVRGGEITQLTRDHSLLEDYRDAKPDMTEQEERDFPHKNVITRALGMRDNIEVAIVTHALATEDKYLLCTDGLSGMVPDPQILEIVVGATNLESAVSELIDAANRKGGVDNITALLIGC